MAQGGLTDGQLTAKPKIIILLIIYGFMMFFCIWVFVFVYFAPEHAITEKNHNRDSQTAQTTKPYIADPLAKLAYF